MTASNERVEAIGCVDRDYSISIGFSLLIEPPEGSLRKARRSKVRFDNKEIISIEKVFRLFGP